MLLLSSCIVETAEPGTENTSKQYLIISLKRLNQHETADNICVYYFRTLLKGTVEPGSHPAPSVLLVILEVRVDRIYPPNGEGI